MSIFESLYPRSESPEFSHAYRGAWQRAESRAKTLNFMHPSRLFVATCRSGESNAVFEILEVAGEGFEVFEELEWVPYSLAKSSATR